MLVALAAIWVDRQGLAQAGPDVRTWIYVDVYNDDTVRLEVRHSERLKTGRELPPTRLACLQYATWPTEHTNVQITRSAGYDWCIISKLMLRGDEYFAGTVTHEDDLMGFKPGLLALPANGEEYRLTVTFPGSVISHVGGSVDGRSCTWTARTEGGQLISAIGRADPDPPHYEWLAAGIVAGLLLLGAGAWFGWRASRSAQSVRTEATEVSTPEELTPISILGVGSSEIEWLDQPSSS